MQVNFYFPIIIFVRLYFVRSAYPLLGWKTGDWADYETQSCGFSNGETTWTSYFILWSPYGWKGKGDFEQKQIHALLHNPPIGNHTFSPADSQPPCWSGSCLGIHQDV